MAKKNLVIIRNAAAHDFGGGERFPVFLADILNNSNYSPVIISRSEKLLAFAKQSSVKTIRGWWWPKQQWSGVNNLLIPIYLLWQVALFFYYLVAFNKMKPIAVHIQSKDDFIAATYAASALKIPVVWTDHADLKHIWKNITVRYKNPIGKMIYKAARHASSITVVSNSEKSLISEHLPSTSNVADKLQVIYNGVVDRTTEYPKNTNGFTFLIASRLVSDKGINEALAAYEAFSKKHPDTRLLIIGDGPEASLFKQKALSIQGVQLLGHQNDPLAFMAKADVFIHPTYHEGFSVALVEAGMMSLPIIATAVGGNVEIIEHNKTGLLIAMKDSDDLLHAMEEIYTNTSLRESLGKNARIQYEKNFQFDNIVKENFIPLYEVNL